MKHPIVQEDIDVIVSAIKKEAKQLEGKRILITGGTGFLGNYFLSVFYDLNKKVLKTPCKVIVIDNYITGDKKNILGLEKSSHFKFIEHDVRVPIKVSGNIDYIIHAAGIASPVYYMKYPLETIEVATKGTQNMLELARLKKVKSFLFSVQARYMVILTRTIYLPLKVTEAMFLRRVRDLAMMNQKDWVKLYV